MSAVNKIWRAFWGDLAGLDKDDNLLVSGTKLILDHLGERIEIDGAGAGNLYISPTVSSFATTLQAANNSIRDAGGGNIVLKSGAVYVLASGVTLDVGTGVGLIGNGAIIDARTCTGSAITLASRARTAGFQLGGVYDSNTRNYHQKRTKVGGFSLIGPGSGSAIDAIDFNMNPAVSTRSPRPTVDLINIEGFRYAIRHRNFAYLGSFSNMTIDSCARGVLFEGGTDQGEQTAFTNITISGCDIAIEVAAGTDNVDAVFNGGAIDYNIQQFKWTSGYGIVHFNQTHFEHNDGTTATPFDCSAGAAAGRSLVTLDRPQILHTGGSRTYASYFSVGSDIEIKLRDPFIHSLQAANGVLIGSAKGPSSADVYVGMLCNASGTGRFACDGIREFANPALGAVSCGADDNQWLSDFGFEQTTVQDLWYDDSSAVGTTIGTLATVTADFLAGARSLQIPILGAAAANRRLKCLVPVGGKKFAMRWFFKLSAGSGSGTFTVQPVVARDGASGVPTITRAGTAFINGASFTPVTTGWSQTGTAGSIPRHDVPAWATHILMTFNLDNINNASGNLWFDNVYVTGW
jgi:hypothetical protein